MKRPQRVTSETWRGLSPEARADLYSSDVITPATLAVLATGFDPLDGHEQPFRATLSMIIRAAYVAGAERELALQVAAESANALRLKYERVLLENGIRPPTLSD